MFSRTDFSLHHTKDLKHFVCILPFVMLILPFVMLAYHVGLVLDLLEKLDHDS